MGTLIALKNLVHGKARTLVAMGGICFAVTLLFMQLGFFAAVSRVATLVHDALDFDLVIVSPRYVTLTQAGTFPQSRLYQARSHPDVEAAMPLYVARNYWRNPDTRYRRGVVMIGVNPDDPVSRSPELAQQIPALARPNTVLVDRLSRPEVGVGEVGLITDITGRPVETVGQFTLGPGFEAGLIVVSDKTFSRLFGGISLHQVNLGLVKLRPGADPRQVAEQLIQALPPDVRVMTREQATDLECHYWIVNTSTGIIFSCGVAVAILFGVVITYQVLSMEVSHRLPEYAVLKAMGFSDTAIAAIVLRQAVVFAVVSFVPGFVAALVIYAMSAGVTNLPVGMTVERAVAVFFLNLLMCCVSGVFALRILRRADPVDLLYP
jgi:putative ABC transport system permease protein